MPTYSDDGYLETYLVLNPRLDQAQAIAHTLRLCDWRCRVLGGLLPGQKPFRSPLYAGFSRVTTTDDLRDYDRVYFTGGKDFEHFAVAGLDCHMGGLVQESRNLDFFSKPWSIRYCERLAIPTPTTWLEAAAIPADAGPVFYKAAREGGPGLRGVATHPGGIPREVHSADCIFQERIPGRQVVGFGFVAERGTILESYQHLELDSSPPSGGAAIAAVFANIPRVAELASRLLSSYRYSGWGLIEFKYDERRNDYVFMELNPKLWASVELGLRAHPRFASLVLGCPVPKEPLHGIWWPSRILRNGPAHWWSGLQTARGLSRSRERIGLRAVAAGLFTTGVRSKLRQARALR